LAELTRIFYGSVLTMAESTNKLDQYFGRLGHKKRGKKAWPSCPGRVGFGRVDWQSLASSAII